MRACPIPQSLWVSSFRLRAGDVWSKFKLEERHSASHNKKTYIIISETFRRFTGFGMPSITTRKPGSFDESLPFLGALGSLGFLGAPACVGFSGCWGLGCRIFLLHASQDIRVSGLFGGTGLEAYVQFHQLGFKAFVGVESLEVFLTASQY